MNTEHTIRELAHQIWISEGKPEGQSEKHWAQACELAAQKTRHPNPKRSIDPSEATGPTEPEQPDQT